MVFVLHALVFTLAAESSGCRLLLVRHGETNYNADGRIQGRLESELTSKGLSQATGVGTWLSANYPRGKGLDRIYVSPRKRTRQTLEQIKAVVSLPGKIEVRPGLREIELIQWEGQDRKDLRDSSGSPDSERWARWKARPANFVFEEDGHSPLGDLKRRAAKEWIAIVSASPPEGMSLVIAHGAFNRVFLLTALGIPVDDHTFRDESSHFAFENCETVELKWDLGAAHASAWRRRYPSESEWITREEEYERVHLERGEQGEAKIEL